MDSNSPASQDVLALESPDVIQYAKGKKRKLPSEEDLLLIQNLHSAINSVQKQNVNSSNGTTLETELQLSILTKTRSTNVNNLYIALLTLEPTSTDSERVFSVCGNILTKAKNRMSSKLFNAFVFLNYYFKDNPKR